MKRLYALRHTKSDRTVTGVPDHDRPLNPRGRKAAKRLATYFGESDMRPGLVLCSTARRARATLTPIEAELADVPIRHDRGVYEADAIALLGIVREAPPPISSLLLVGHNPSMQDLVLLLSDEEGPYDAAVTEKFPTGALATLDLGITHWAEARPGCARIVDLVTPKTLGRPPG